MTTEEKLRFFADALWEADYLHGYSSQEDLWSLGVEDSLAVLKFVQLGGRVLDIGPGGGLPGLVLAIALANATFTLVDSSQKACKFLSQMKVTLNLDNVEILHSRAEDYGRNHREEFDFVISRAVAELPILAEYVAAPMKCGGEAILWKGPSWQEELTAAGTALGCLHLHFEHAFTYSIMDRTRVLVVLRKTQPTPYKFPRKAGLPEKKPL
jgi:16S rRNA (guanine527-N7)-methyltransferase